MFSDLQSLARPGARATSALKRVATLTRVIATAFAERLVTWLLLVVLCSMLAHWTWILFTPAVAPIPAVSATPIDPAAAAAAISQSHVFAGAAPRTPIAARTTLDAKLVAVVRSERASSWAVLGLKNRPNTLFREGSEIEDGTVLERVYRDHVVVRRNAVLERIDFPRTAQAGTPAQSFGLSVQQQAPNQLSFSRAALAGALQDPTQRAQIGALNVIAGTGVVIAEAPPGSLAQKLSLQAGDTIRRVNGEAVTSEEDLLRLYQKFTGTGQVTLEGTRKDAPLNLTYSVNP